MTTSRTAFKTAESPFRSDNTASNMCGFTLMNQWLSTWTARCLVAARELQPIWSQPDSKPPRFEDALDRAKVRFSGILRDLGLNDPKELTQ